MLNGRAASRLDLAQATEVSVDSGSAQCYLNAMHWLHYIVACNSIRQALVLGRVSDGLAHVHRLMKRRNKQGREQSHTSQAQTPHAKPQGTRVQCILQEGQTQHDAAVAQHTY